jgi:hypothetical protein
MAPLAFGLVYDLLGTYPREPGDPPDVDAEFEPEATLEVLKAAVRRLGHRPVRLGNPHALLAPIGKGELPPRDLALSAEDAETLILPGAYPLFVKPRWEGTAKGIGPSSRVRDRAALVRNGV